MRKFKSAAQAQRFLSAHAAVYSLLNLGRRLVSAESYRCSDSVPLHFGKRQRRYKKAVSKFFTIQAVNLSIPR